jgi:hypothetical protein
MFKPLTLGLVAVALSGCAASGPSDYAVYAETQRQIATAQSAAEIARYQALQEIAAKGDSAASVAAAMGIAMGNGTGPTRASAQVSAPKSLGEKLLPWASIIVPSAVQVFGIGKNADVAINSSNNARDVAINTNETMLGFGGKIVEAGSAPIVGTQDDVLLYPR